MARRPGQVTPTYRRVTRPCRSCDHPRTCRWDGTHWTCGTCGASWNIAADVVLYAAPGAFTDRDLAVAMRGAS